MVKVSPWVREARVRSPTASAQWKLVVFLWPMRFSKVVLRREARLTKCCDAKKNILHHILPLEEYKESSLLYVPTCNQSPSIKSLHAQTWISGLEVSAFEIRHRKLGSVPYVLCWSLPVPSRASARMSQPIDVCLLNIALPVNWSSGIKKHGQTLYTPPPRTLWFFIRGAASADSTD